MVHRSASPAPFRAFRRLSVTAFLALLLISELAAAERISFIERFQKEHVTIHFDTKANRTYELQFLKTLTCPTNKLSSCNKSGVSTELWETLFVAPNIPFPSHYIVIDSRTNRSRFYRLKVTP